MKTMALLFLFAPKILALEITTLDGQSYHDCRVSKVYPDSICVLFSGGGARIKFTNLPESARREYGYEPERATAFEKAEADRKQRERALFAAQLQQLEARKPAQQSPPAANPLPAPPAPSPGGNNAALPGSAYSLNQPASYARGGAQYAVVRIGGPGGGIYGVTYSPVSPRPRGF